MKYEIYFRIPFFKYFIAKDLECKKLCFVYKVFSGDESIYRFKEI